MITKKPIYRARFYTKIEAPLYLPTPYPVWCSGETCEEEPSSILITYLEDPEEVYKFWPEADRLTYTEESEVTYTDRFPKLKSYKESDVTAERVLQDRRMWIKVEEYLPVTDSLVKKYGSKEALKDALDKHIEKFLEC